MNAKEIIELIKSKRIEKKLSWASLAKELDGHEVWVTSALLGQNTLGFEQARKACELLDIQSEEVINFLSLPKLKGSIDGDVVADPLIYRFHEVTQVYATSIKEIIHEKFGDGIMSAIDFTLDIKKEENPNGDRVIVTYNGKFLPYKKW